MELLETFNTPVFLYKLFSLHFIAKNIHEINFKVLSIKYKYLKVIIRTKIYLIKNNYCNVMDFLFLLIISEKLSFI